MKKKKQGHYCRVCGEHKANEKFSGKGHAKHICKKCSSLSAAQRNELQKANKIELPYEIEEFDEDEFMESEPVETITWVKLGNEEKDCIQADMYDVISEFILDAGYIPEKKHKHKIIEAVCSEIYSGDGKQLIIDESLSIFFEEILQAVIKDLREEGIEPESYLDTLVILETERLKIRRFIMDDLPALHAIMEKEEVMYAWEHGFTKAETRKWLSNQLKRYKKDGYSYFAVILKETGELIGQAGLLKNEIDGKEVVELGYIFDNLYWKQGYCIESVKACSQFAFDTLNVKELYCSIRPENEASIRVAEKLGMKKTGEHIKVYLEKEMLHIIYRLIF